jgi:APA family basic amino acid/polyamine antiporter
MAQLPLVTWWRFFIWMVIGLVIYVLYGFRRSRIAGRKSE